MHGLIVSKGRLIFFWWWGKGRGEGRGGGVIPYYTLRFLLLIKKTESHYTSLMKLERILEFQNVQPSRSPRDSQDFA